MMKTSPSITKPGLPLIFTTVTWMTCALGGIAGLRLQYQQAQAHAREQPPVTAQQLDVKMVGSAASPLPAQIPPPRPDEPAALPQLPVIAAVAEVLPAISIAVPQVAPQPRTLMTAPIQHLTFGTGEGDKPPPEYPREAKIARQQGTVVVQFTVSEDGKVIDARAITPSPYSLLNQAAVRAVRDTWDFPKEKVRVYDVSFQFELHQK